MFRPFYSKTYHKWEQPFTWCLDLIKYLTNEGDLVCDPFLGSGTVAVACEYLNRKFIGCDIDKNCINNAEKRLKNFRNMYIYIMYDKINASFQILNSFFLFFNVYKIYKDKNIAGVSLTTTLYFALFNIWNVYYFLNIDQWFSFWCSILCAIAINYLVCSDVFLQIL